MKRGYSLIQEMVCKLTLKICSYDFSCMSKKTSLEISVGELFIIAVLIFQKRKYYFLKVVIVSEMNSNLKNFDDFICSLCISLVLVYHAKNEGF